MNHRDQCIKQYSYALGYLTNEDIQKAVELKSNSVEEYLLKNKKLPQLQYNYLKLIFMKHSLLIAAKSVVNITPQQIETVLKMDIENVKNNIHPKFGALEKKIIALPSLAQILKIVGQVLPPQELKILEFMINQARSIAPQSTGDTRGGESTFGQTGKKKESKIPDTLGDYKIQELIGAGGMGKVFKAFHINLERMVAIKVMLSQTESARKRFLLEAKLTAKMQHPNIIPIHDIKTQDNLDYIVMDFIQGKPLSDVLNEGKLSIEKIMDIIKPVLAAVGYAHSYKVIHRDLKPPNILIEDNTQRPLVMDFGLAKQLDEQVDDKITMSGQLLGSPRYMAPEQANAEQADHLADIYALGAIFYEMITGQPAIDGGSLGNVIFKITQQKFLRPREIDPSIPVALEKICLKAMALKKEQRYQKAEDFIEALNSYQTVDKTGIIDIKRTSERKSINRKTLAMRSTQRQKKQIKKKTNFPTIIITVAAVLLFVIFIGFISMGKKDSRLNNRKIADENENKAQSHSQKVENSNGNEVAQKQPDSHETKNNEVAQKQPDSHETKNNEVAQKQPESHETKNNEVAQKQPESHETKNNEVAQKQPESHETKNNEVAQKQPESHETNDKPKENYPSLDEAVRYTQKGRVLEVKVFEITPHLKDLPRGKPLFISFRYCKNFEDIGISYVKNLNVVALDLQEIPVTETGLKYVSFLRRLQNLDLDGAKITGDSLSHISNLPLTYLDADSTNINDSDLNYLLPLRRTIMKLNVKYTQITDESITTLSSFSLLNSLEIKGTNITRQGYKKLGKALPHCVIEY